jgi:tungstate transport system substrate-binding protein
MKEYRMYFSLFSTNSSKRLYQAFSLLIGFSLLATAHAEEQFIKLATTTSTENSGLLGYLLPDFEKQHPYEIKVISVGTGKALRLLKEGDVDVVLVHARAAENKMVAEGFGVNRADVMYNDFVIVGPARDPAGIANSSDVDIAFKRIADSKSLFISRGDDSGTHKKELGLWHESGITPDGEWYREVGQGMGKALQIASELQAYTLTDRGTWLAYQDKLPLKVLAEGDQHLFNPYGIMAANPDKYPDTNYKGAMALINWIISPSAQKKIADFSINGNTLFTPLHQVAEAPAH